MYKFAERVATKLIHQTDSPDPDLRQLVGHSHLLDAVAPYLIDDEEYLRQTAPRHSYQLQASRKNEAWECSLETVDEDHKDSDSDASDESEQDWDEAILQMADAVYIEIVDQMEAVSKPTRKRDVERDHRRSKDRKRSQQGGVSATKKSSISPTLGYVSHTAKRRAK